jgi:hypothetical protein
VSDDEALATDGSGARPVEDKAGSTWRQTSRSEDRGRIPGGERPGAGTVRIGGEAGVDRRLGRAGSKMRPACAIGRGGLASQQWPK